LISDPHGVYEEHCPPCLQTVYVGAGPSETVCYDGQTDPPNNARINNVKIKFIYNNNKNSPFNFNSMKFKNRADETHIESPALAQK